MTTKSSPRLFVTAVLALALLSVVPALRADQPAPDKPLSKAKAKYDADKDGKLSDDERARMADDAAEKQEEKAEKILEKYDLNKNGKLDPEEKAAWEADRKAAREARKAAHEKRQAEKEARQAAADAKKTEKDAGTDAQK